MTADQTLQYKNQSIFHVIGLILVIAVNGMAELLPINEQRTGEVSDKYPNLLVPAGFTFSIWGVIYLALLGFTVYQLWLAFRGDHAQELTAFMTRIRHWWLVSCLANACWLFAWHYEMLPLSLLLMLVLLVSLVYIHRNFSIWDNGAPWKEKLYIHFPFSLYLGWISFAAIANITALMVYWGWHGQGISQVAWAVLMISLSTGLSAYMVLQHQNITFAMVTVWALYGIILKRRHANVIAEHLVIQTCIIAIGLIAIAISWKWYRQRG
ncbi:tryptophan-rich sensory protein [Chitinophaga japonensis]|uniref:TspO/MBR family protein n=1 Tax=Chitinophaga japonensis TaxID=104662 RepID=A0A562SZV3_CHIJA|nr:tryptophan-rich sensory protein [Chitinophaga japonensis]TWI86568.1 TspO/MBR family protein [Chitinophaga japonensis]